MIGYIRYERHYKKNVIVWTGGGLKIIFNYRLNIISVLLRVVEIVSDSSTYPDYSWPVNALQNLLLKNK